MSKTDKTQPWWVQVTVWEPAHMCDRWHLPCDLPAHAPTNHNEASRFCRATVCYWTPVDWNEITFSKYQDWYMDTERNRSRLKRQWRKDWDVA